MKSLFLLLIILSFTISCEKEKSDYFLVGRLLYIDTELPVVGEQISLYQDYSGGFAGISLFEKKEKHLQTVITDANGYFYFDGKGYNNKNTYTINPASLRLSKNGQTWEYESLGFGKAARKEEATNCIQDTGDIYKE